MHRGLVAIKRQWTRKIDPQVRKLNNLRVLVQAQLPDGADEQQVESMAVAITTCLTDRVDEAFKNYDTAQLPFYGAWKVLKNCPEFGLTETTKKRETQTQRADIQVP